MGQSNINPTTIWTPQTGFLNQPGTLTAGYQYQPQVTSVYDVPGLLLPALDCTQANGGAFVSSSCVDQNDAIQKENFARTAAYNAGTLKLPTTPATTPAAPNTAPTTPGVCTQPDYFNAAGVCIDPWTSLPIPGVPNKIPPAGTPKATPPQTGGTTAASTNAGGGTDKVPVTTTSAVNPMLYWIAGLAAASLLIYVAVNK